MKIIIILLIIFLASFAYAKDYNAYCTRVVDGDTIVAVLDLGFGITLKEKIRFLDYDAPETFRPKSQKEKDLGEKAKKYLRELIEGKNILLKVPKKERGKYGRVLAEVFIRDINIAETMKLKGFVK